MCSKSIFVLCLLGCFVCVRVGVHVFICVHYNGLFGFISLWQITRWTCIPSYSSAEYPFTPIFFLALCHHIDTFTVRGEHLHTFLLSLCPSGSCAHFFSRHTCQTHNRTLMGFFSPHSLCYYAPTYSPVPSLGPRATQNDMRRVPAA